VTRDHAHGKRGDGKLNSEAAARITDGGRHFCRVILMVGLFVCASFLTAGCGVINPGKWKGIERTSSDEKYYLVKDVLLTPGSTYLSKEIFDHNMNDSINLVFTAVNERNRYVAESRWIDPLGAEYRTIRATYDKQVESKQDFDRKKAGTPRVHSITTKELFNHKPGLWKVVLYLDGELARRMTFTVR